MGNSAVKIGCQGWAYDDWVTPAAAETIFYPQGTRNEEMLEIYARAFSTVEVDSTFYAVPSIAAVDNWNKRTPPGFTFALKLPREITHIQMLRATSLGVLDEFCDRASLLSDKLACVLIQMPPQFDASTENRDALRAFLPHLPQEMRFAIEFRNRGWIDEHTIDFLTERRVAFALVHGEWLVDSDIRWIARNLTSDFTYIRWMGERDLIRFDIVQRPQDANLQRWAKLISYLSERLQNIYGYFSNFYEGHAPAGANKLKRLLSQPVIEPSELEDQQSLF
jgi:uncharacterized protein YecE (DUF72 family)